MKRLFILSLYIMLCVVFMAQTQQGIVKTKGRLNSDGSVSAGQRIAGASVTVKGRATVLSKQNGTFSFPMPDKVYYLQSVQKQGYVLTDPDVLSRQYAYSVNPLELVLETPEQQADDRLAAERRIRRTLRQQLQAKEDEIEALRSEKKLSDEAYRKQLQELYATQESNEKLISEMVERYSKIDFDKVDDFNRRISQLILEGRLTEADSLLNTKGDINSRAVTLRQHQDANAKAEQEIKKRQKKLEKSKALTQKELEDLAQDCYSKFEIFKMQHQNDSAAYYIELRASFDTTNTKWLSEVGTFYYEYQGDYTKALDYYQKALAVKEGSDNSDVGTLYSNIGLTYYAQGNYVKALECYQKSLDVYEKIVGSDHPDIAIDYSNMGVVYDIQGDYVKALEYHQKALAIREKVLRDDHPDIATSYNNIGGMYEVQGDYAKAMDYYQRALTIRENAFGIDHPDVALSYNNIGTLSYVQGNYAKALDYLQKASDIRKKILGSDHPDIATSYNNIGVIYEGKGEYSKALEYYRKSLAIREKVFGNEHLDVAISYNNIGQIYYRQDNYAKALEYYHKTMVIDEKILGSEHPNIARTYNNIGWVYNRQGDYAKALDCYKRALAIREKVFGTEHPSIASCFNNMGIVCYYQGDYVKALDYLKKALVIREKKLGIDHPDTKMTKTSIEKTESKLKETK